jgi:RHS repeat-associated protein
MGPLELFYTYDALSRPIRLTQRTKDGKETTIYLGYRGPSDRIAYMKDSSGEIFHKTSSAPGISAYAEKGPDGTWRVFSQLFDQRGDTTSLVNHLGTLVMTQSYKDYGAQKNPPSIPYGFLGSYGRLHIPQTGLDLLGARYYNPSLGRFLSKDPIEGGSANAYEYAGGDPINKVDPSGRFLFGMEFAALLCWLSGMECNFGGPPLPPRPPSPGPRPSTRNASSPKFGDPSGFRQTTVSWDLLKGGLVVVDNSGWFSGIDVGVNVINQVTPATNEIYYIHDWFSENPKRTGWWDFVHYSGSAGADVVCLGKFIPGCSFGVAAVTGIANIGGQLSTKLW